MSGLKTRKTGWLAVTVAVAAGAFSAGATAQEVDAKALIERMSAEIAELNRFVVHGDAYTDARLEAGLIIEHASQAELRLQRQPAAVRISNRKPERTTEIFFDDGLPSVYNDRENFYAQTEIPKSVDSMFGYAVNEIDSEPPLLVFVSSNLAGDLIKGADEIRYLGTSLIQETTFHHIAIRSSEVDVQLWIATEAQPLPGKLVISSKWETGSPRFVAFFDWETDPDFSPDLFRFDPPNDAIEIGFIADLQDQGNENETSSATQVSSCRQHRNRDDLASGGCRRSW